MKNLMEYKGYHTKIEFDAESMSLRGKIEGINDYIDFESEDISNIEKEFHAAVDDYLKFLSSGSTMDPISLLKIAGVDMASPAPINDALKIFDNLISEMEALCAE